MISKMHMGIMRLFEWNSQQVAHQEMSELAIGNDKKFWTSKMQFFQLRL